MVLQFAGCSNGARGFEALRILSEYKGRPVIKMCTNMGDITIELWNDKTPKTVENFVQLAFGGKEWYNPHTGQKQTGAFYDGLTFHRVVRNYVIQGGCPEGTGNGGPGYYFDDEIFDDTHSKPITGFISNIEQTNRLYTKVIIPYIRKNPSPDKELTRILDQCKKSKNLKPLMSKPIEFYLKKTGTKPPLKEQGVLLSKVDYGTICMANTGPDTNGSQFFIVTKKEGCEWLNGKHTVFGKVIIGTSVLDKIQKVKTTMGYKPIDEIYIKRIELIKPDKIKKQK